jgi:imidazolonepropionase
MTTLWRNAKLATLDNTARGYGPGASIPYGLIENGAMLVEGDTLHWVGPESEMPREHFAHIKGVHDLGGATITPGLVDCHTHLVYAGNRANEFEQRLQGMSYEAIAKSGGGIRATVAATRAATDAELFKLASKRLRALQAEGVTTLEIKSGYGLTLEDEARCLRVARELGKRHAMTVRTTSLAAHAVPPEFDGRPDDYIAAVCEWLPQWAEEDLIDAVDAYCDKIAFSPAQTRKVFGAARSLGLAVKLHAEQLSDQGGAALAAEFSALSCDHLEHLSPQGIEAMARSGVVAVLLPGAYYFLKESKKPPIAALRKAGVPMAVATDHNPGTSPGLSLLLMMNMACTFWGLTPEEALMGATTHAARALGLRERGTLAAGKRADFVVWDVGHPRDLAYAFGSNPCLQVVQGGRVVKSHEH